MRREIIVLLMTCLILFSFDKRSVSRIRSDFLVLAILSDIIIKKINK